MTRLETMRTYFIERFFALLAADTDFAGLTEPKELFDAAGNFNVPPTAAGFILIPTVGALDARIAAASSRKKKDQLRRSRDVLARTLASLYGTLAEMDAPDLLALAARFAPVIRHPDNQRYWPVDTARLLTYNDGILQGELYDKSGRQQLAGGLVERLFEDPAAWAGVGLSQPVFEARLPFAATIGLDGATPPFPASSLTAGHLNLPAADVRLTPGLFQPVLFAEAKSLSASLRNHADYLSTAALGGRFAPLACNRIETDPAAAFRSLAVSEPVFTDIGDTMIIYHGFYPADDGVRRMNDGSGANREFHHVAVGILLGSSSGSGSTSAGGGYLLVTAGPTEARILPLGHPSIRSVDDDGSEGPAGSHPIVYASRASPQSLSFSNYVVPNAAAARQPSKAGSSGNEFLIGLYLSTTKGAKIGSFAGPFGEAVGVWIGALAFLWDSFWDSLVSLVDGDDDDEEWTEGPALDRAGPPSEASPQSKTHDIGPPGVASDSGGGTPARSYELKLIPHLPDDNLYGLAFAGADTFRIVDDMERQETLAWHSFTGGIGYQFNRPLAGRAETAGTSIQNYFSLFLRKIVELRQAQAQVVYFGT